MDPSAALGLPGHHRLLPVSGIELMRYEPVYGSFPDRPERGFEGRVLDIVPRDKAASLHAANPCTVILDQPIATLSLACCPIRVLRAAARCHGIKVTRVGERDSRVFSDLVLSHSCSGSCTETLVMYSIHLCQESWTVGVGGGAGGGAGTANAVAAPFPPVPPDVTLLATMAREFDALTHPSALEEAGCGVCARLTLLRDLLTFAMRDINLEVLARPGEGVTRKERLSLSDPIEEHAGPILAEEAVQALHGIPSIRICRSCAGCILKNRLPRHSLANGRWLGAIPAVLAKLNYVEQLGAAIYRHSPCVAQVSMGQHYLSANVIVFGQPIDRVYRQLPPPRQDIEEILAILFAGSAQPTDADMRRTPFLFRHSVFVRAVEWLMCNSRSYKDVTISKDNLLEYPDDRPPVQVLYRKVGKTGPAEGLASHESSSNRGVDGGECPFIVHTLTGDNLAEMSAEARIAFAIRYFDSDKPALAYGHSRKPESIYHNPELYPGLFPWLYPYGLGGFENSKIKLRLDHIEHVRANLMYADRRFQRDRCFPFIVFNQRQIRSSAQGGYLLTKKGDFDTVVEKMLSIDREALDSIIDRAGAGESVKPRNDAEKRCFDLISIVDRVAGHVQGSATGRKYCRNEIKSLIYEKGVPVFFVMFAPADFKHPLCLYYCGEKFDVHEFAPQLRSSDDRLRAIASNPVGAARFFDTMVNAFVKIILGCGSNHDGLFGPTSAYYGTVESQARLTLHLHMLVWIEGSISPQELRDRVRADPTFSTQVVDWLENAHRGDYSASTDDDLALWLHEEYVDNRWGTSQIRTRLRRDVRDPATVLPHPAPQTSDSAAIANWWQAVQEDADEVVFVSNRHDKQHSKGCWRGDPGYCRARFPRELFDTSQVDTMSGAIRFAKHEAWINTYHPLLSYLLRCNSDVTCLLSGTQVKAIVAYVTDYITKCKLTTESFFEIVRTVLDRNSEALDDSGLFREDLARSLVVKVVNALGSSAETGGPAVCSYLLGFPDHYTDHVFRAFYWQPFCRYVRRAYEANNHAADESQDHVLLGMSDSGVVQLSKIQDYVFRPSHFDDWTLYDYMRLTDIRRLPRGKKRPAPDNEMNSDVESASEHDDDDDNSPILGSQAAYRFRAEHPLRNSHAVYERQRSKIYTLNFTGAPLPRRDKGDVEEYALTMLTLFKPGGWRSATDLKKVAVSWNDVHQRTPYAATHVQVMKNMNALFECQDARDDYSAARRADGHAGGVLVGERGPAQDCSQAFTQVDDEIEYTDTTLADAVSETPEGPRTSKHNARMQAMRTMLGPEHGNRQVRFGPTEPEASSTNIPFRTPAQWKQLVQNERKEALKRMRGHLQDNCESVETHRGFFTSEDGVVREITVDQLERLKKLNVDVSRGRQDPQVLLLHGVIEKFTLNEEQLRAFSIAARHLHHHEKDALRMYLGGMAGTGKSRVLLSLMSFLDERKESHRFIILGPTGASASLVGGSTYHSVLGLSVSKEEEDGQATLKTLEKVRGRLEDVDMAFVDEVSMVSCLAFFHIHTQLNKAFGDCTRLFGGLSMIFAGDFAQLPPGGPGYALYDDRVGAWGANLSSFHQNCAIGKAAWHQFTCVVILRQNMRQRGLSSNDSKFRKALENMHYAACSPDDIRLLATRVCRPDRGDTQHLQPQFRDVSIITCYNVHRDAINEVKAKQFANTNNEPLHQFHSVDRWGRGASSSSVRKVQKMAKHFVDPVRTVNVIPDKLQEMIWKVPPSLTKHHAGVLELCRGMPVLLKFNEATELCATNGAEAVVHDWVSSVHHGKLILDTLYVRLVNPPRAVKLPGLDVNIIPLGRNTRTVPCILPAGDVSLSLSRDQVMVLPNFAMTDFGSQGRTRPYNVVHLEHCPGHQSIYTCLSRSSSLEGTLILGPFPSSHIERGPASALRREFRELELLDEITRLRLTGKLPEAVLGSTRQVLITSYRRWKGLRHVPEHVPVALDWTAACDQELEVSESGYDFSQKGVPADDESLNIRPKRAKRGEKWTAVKRGKPKKSNTLPDNLAAYDVDGEPPASATGIESSTRLGLIWDSRNYSCGYDAIMTILWNLYVDEGAPWLDSVASDNGLVVVLRDKFALASDSPECLEQGRDDVRTLLAALDPVVYPRTGPHGVALSEVLSVLLFCPTVFGAPLGRCTACESELSVPMCARSCFWPVAPHLWDNTLAGRVDVQAREFAELLVTSLMPTACTVCGAATAVETVLFSAPPLLAFESTDGANLIPSEHLTLPVQGGTVMYALRGVVYFSGSHYTSRYIERTGATWFHDGIVTGRRCIRDGENRSSSSLAVSRGNRASHYIYVREDKPECNPSGAASRG